MKLAHKTLLVSACLVIAGAAIIDADCGAIVTGATMMCLGVVGVIFGPAAASM